MKALSFDDLEKNKVCVITGGAGVIGKALAQGLIGSEINSLSDRYEQRKVADKVAACCRNGYCQHWLRRQWCSSNLHLDRQMQRKKSIPNLGRSTFSSTVLVEIRQTTSAAEADDRRHEV
ncbi:MAG: hypothetical protein U5K79_23125 [Cyclobacteriaceae bacterium]|nr:hypothetical protein [Cyclobacteriaceae bacterium]